MAVEEVTGYRNAINSAKIFSQLNPYFISVDSLTLFPGTKLFDMEKDGKFIQAGEKERIQELQTFIQSLRIRTHLFANSKSNFYPITAYLPKDQNAYQWLPLLDFFLSFIKLCLLQFLYALL